MNLFFEESGDFKSGAVLSQQGEAYQVELPSGKRVKVRAKDVLLQFADPAAAAMLSEAEQISQEIDIPFLWEVAGVEEFAFADLGTEYFGHVPHPAEAAGLLMQLHAAPIYFYKKGKGRYKAAPAAALNAALAGIEKKKKLALVQADYVQQLKDGVLPDAMHSLVQQLLFKPDKNSIEYKALDAACHELQTTPEHLVLSTGGFASARALHLARFQFEYFPKGIGFPDLAVPAEPELPLADVHAFSIDDASTTEIDDAFSIQALEDGLLRIGIHIAAPALGIHRDDALDQVARQRMSTVYAPALKITMLPTQIVDAYTLAAGKSCPALSLYAVVDPIDWSVVSTESRAELVSIASNLRHNDLDALVSPEQMEADSGDFPHHAEIAQLWHWALALEKARMAKRESFGLRPEQTNRVDFSFSVQDDVVTIERRKRGAPLDKIVAELMIFANSTWGKFLHEHGVPGIYRSQSGTGGWAARMQVRMVTHAAPHHGLGVDQYIWATSPLRRYPDLLNQWQILACIEHGVAAPLVAPFKPRDADLYAIVSAFEGIYAGYSEFQSNIERYWCLRWLAQQKAHRMEAAVLKDEVVRLTEIPLVLKLAGLQQLARGTQVQLDILNWDEISLEVEARLHLVSTGTTQGATELLVPLNDDDEINTIDSVNAVTEPLAVDDTVQQSVAH